MGHLLLCPAPAPPFPHPPRRRRPVPGRRASRQRAKRAAQRARLLAQADPELREAAPHLALYECQSRSPRDFSGPPLLAPEHDAGSVEYKLRLVDPSPPRFHQLVRRMRVWCACAWWGGREGGARLVLLKE